MDLLNNKSISKFVSYTIAVATIIAGSNIVPVSADTAPLITETGGWYESAYVEWTPSDVIIE